MSKTIYVPQGYSARIRKVTEVYGINGLYTDNFTLCNIVACIGLDKAVLMHIDNRNAIQHIQKEINWVDEPKQVFIMFRSGDGEGAKQELLAQLQVTMPSITPIVKKVDNAYGGIYLSLQAHEQNDIHPTIKKFMVHDYPNQLIHHPQEQQFLTVRKIEQIIGTRAMLQPAYCIAKLNRFRICIFNSFCWENLDPSQLKINDSHEFTQREMAIFTPDDSFADISAKILQIMNALKPIMTIIGDEEMIASKASMFVEDYLHNYQYEYLFKRNLKQMMDYFSCKPLSAIDYAFKKSFIALLAETEANIFSNIEQAMEKYLQEAPDTEFKKTINREYQRFVEHYVHRNYYYEHEQIARQYQQRARRQSDYAQQAYRTQQCESAVNLYLDSLKSYTYSCLKDNPELAWAYYNYGISLYQVKRYQEARSFLHNSLLLQEHYIQPRATAQNLAKIQDALNKCDECLAALSQQATNKPTHLLPAF